MQKFRTCPSIAVPPNQRGHVQAQFALAISLYHAWAILNSYDYRSVLNMLNCFKRDVVQNNVCIYFNVYYNTKANWLSINLKFRGMINCHKQR